jgi:pre-mRNA-splicing factor CWC22
LIVDICAQQSTYEPFFGLLGRHICLEGGYVYWFECIFEDVCSISHPFRDVQSRNVAKFFAHLLATDSISWSVCVNS